VTKVAPPSKARPRVAYDLGRRGETLPDDWHDDDELSGAYEMGVDDRDAATAGSSRRHGPPEPRRSHEDHQDDTSSAPEGDSKSRRESARDDVQSAAVPWSSHPLNKGSTGGGLFLGIIGYCIARALILEGPPGIWRWYSAKFMNKQIPRGSASSSSATAPAPQPTPQAGTQPTPTTSAATFTSTNPGRVLTT
jgi:hypothetical protein